MMEEKPGVGFRPYEDELLYYLHHKIHGNHSYVDGVINEIEIYRVDPWNLRFQSREPVLYFFSRRENKYANGNQQSRTTPSGFWKLTGKPVAVHDQWGHSFGSRGKKIGYKRVLTFTRGKNNTTSEENKNKPKPKSEWVMHELHYTLLPEAERTYVVCRLEYKGDDVNILSSNATDLTPTFVPNSASSAVVDQGNSGYYNNPFPENQDPQFSGILESCQEYADYLSPILDYGLPNQSSWSSAHLNLEQPLQVPFFENDWDMQFFEQHNDSLEMIRTREDRSHYCPKKPVTRRIDSSSDSDTDSMIGRDDAWSSTDSVSSKDEPYLTPSLTTVEPLYNHEPQNQLEGKEKVINKQKSECESKMSEDSIKKAPSTTVVKQSWIVLEDISQRNSRWVHLNYILIGLLLFISIIVWIILVG